MAEIARYEKKSTNVGFQDSEDVFAISIHEHLILVLTKL